MAPGFGGKRAQHLRAARDAKRRKAEAIKMLPEIVISEILLARVDIEEEESPACLENSFWKLDLESPEDEEEGDEEEEYEYTDNEEESVELNQDAFEIMIAGGKKRGAFDNSSFQYQRTQQPSHRTVQRNEKNKKEWKSAAINTLPLDNYFPPQLIDHSISQISNDTEIQYKLQQNLAIHAIERKLSDKKLILNKQTVVRYQAVAAFLRVQQGKQLEEKRIDMAKMVARCFGKGIYFARKIITWEIEWMRDNLISEGRRGCFAKTRSWFNDEGVQQAVRDWLGNRSSEGLFLYYFILSCC